MNAKAKSPQIVIVDDDLDIQNLVCAFFKPKGFDVICYGDAETALRDSLKNGHQWDVLLTDLNLPRMSGLDFTIQLKKILPKLPIILVTVSSSAEVAIEAIEKGAYDYIVKPIHFAQLSISVQRALHLKNLNMDLLDLRERVKLGNPHPSKIIGRSPKFLAALDVAKRVAKSSANIFISGESGTGKEIFAKFIHSESRQQKGPFVAINCSAIPENLLESELFGHAKGSFTGALNKKIGLFEEAENGTLFLDEIGDLSLPLQAKLLRVLQEKQIKRVGENQFRAINCRIISATHKNLVEEMKENRFRDDLFFRLNVIPIVIPPLRERPEDLLLLAESFLKKFAQENDVPVKSFAKEAVKFILENPWKGNVRELENTIERAVVLCVGSEINKEHFLPFSTSLAASACETKEASLTDTNENSFCVRYSSRLPNLNEIIHKYIEHAVEKNNGARDKTALDIGIDRKTLYKRLKSENGMFQ